MEFDNIRNFDEFASSSYFEWSQPQCNLLQESSKMCHFDFARQYELGDTIIEDTDFRAKIKKYLYI